MVRFGFLSATERAALVGLARNGALAHRLARRANALLLIDKGWSCARVAEALLPDDDTVRDWSKIYNETGLEGLLRFEAGGGASHLTRAQEEACVVFVTTHAPRSAAEAGAYIERAFGVVYESRSGLIALLHRPGFEYRKPGEIGRRLDADKQKAFIAFYETLLNAPGPDESVLFADAVHPTHATRPAGCRAPAGARLAAEQTSGRQRLNIHGAINLETGATVISDAETVDAVPTIRLLKTIGMMHPQMTALHVFLDNARYHHALVVKEWLAEPGRRIKLHFVPAYCPHLNPTERLWGLMHKHLTHNKYYATYREFTQAALNFLRKKVPGNWPEFCDSVTDNFRVLDPADFRVIA